MASAWIKFYPSDWLAGTRGMTAAETGIYITLIAMMYERDGEIENNPTRLARLCGIPGAGFRRALDALVDDGKIIVDGNMLTNKRVVETLSRHHEIETASRAAANSRWGKKSNKNNEGPHASASEAQCETDAYQKPDTRYQKDTPIKSPQGEPDGFADFWQAYPRKVGKPKALKAYRSALARASPGQILTGARRLAAEREGEDDRFTPHPTTWINRDGWNDPPTPKEARRNATGTSHTDSFLASWMGGQPAPGPAGGGGDEARRVEDQERPADAPGGCLEGRFERVG